MRSLHLRRAFARLVLAVLAAAVVACGGAAADTPSGVVRQAVDLLKAKDLDRLGTLACAEQRATIAEQFGFAGGQLARLVPGLEFEEILEAVDFDVARITLTETAVDADRAEVRMGGTLGVSFDPDRIRDLLRVVAEQQGTPVDEGMVDLLVGQLATFTQNVPVDQTLALVREDGAWRICGTA